MTKLDKILDLIRRRAEENLERWGDAPRADTLWLMIFVEEVGEVAKSLLDKSLDDLLDELLDCAAVIVAWIADRTTE